MARRHGRSEQRVLYWFRSPPFVKVGRTPLDEEAIRLLEERHPDVTFDWNRILREPPQQLSEEEAARRRDQRESREARRRRRRAPEEAPGGQRIARDLPPTATIEPQSPPDLTDIEAPAEFEEPAELGGAHDREDSVEGGDVEEFRELAKAAVSLERAEVEELEEDEDIESSVGVDEPLAPHSPAAAHSAASELLGVDGAARLRNRYVVLKQRIDRLPDQARREQLRAEAAPLDPDAWATVEAARAELETYEARFEALRSQVGGGRRRRRRRRGGGSGGSRRPA